MSELPPRAPFDQAQGVLRADGEIDLCPAVGQHAGHIPCGQRQDEPECQDDVGKTMVSENARHGVGTPTRRMSRMLHNVQ